ncbi:MAG TPA: class I SAM-dependent methyltransferase [Myxococcota bacterium]|nr:class I SAM-dependent methyltransferase [Myxococcota bacterium]
MAEATDRESTQRVQRFYDASAGEYDGWITYYERWMKLADASRALLAHARGDVLEIAVGTGRNFAFYPPGIRLTGIDLSPAMLARATARAKQIGLAADLRIGNAHGLEFPDDCFDTAVVTLALSAIPDCARAAAELHRVLRPGGALLVLDHVRSPIGAVRLIERVIDPVLQRKWAFSLLRDPLDYLEPLGFRIECCERTRLGVLEALVARKL